MDGPPCIWMEYPRHRDLRESDIAQVRRFDRLVERRVNELQRRALISEVSWAGMLVIQELVQVQGGRSVAWLRGRIDLDRGYLCRVMQELCARELVRCQRPDRDRRLREFELTRDGVEQAAIIEAIHRREALHMLDLLLPRERRRLVRAMRTVEQVLTDHPLPEFSEPWTSAARKRARYR